MELAVSILGIINDQEKINTLNVKDVNYIHLDVMDGEFVTNQKQPENSIKYPKPVDIHLMAYDIKKYLEYYKDLDIAYVTFHFEIGNVPKQIELIKSYGVKVGMAINPNTNVFDVLPYLEKIDMLLIMSVAPGYGGQVFLDDTVEKVNYFEKYRDDYDLNYKIEVDGGINDQVIKKLNTDIVVVGNYITASDNYDDQIAKLVNR